MTFPKFPQYSCAGDRITWSAEGYDLTATIHHDHDSKPGDSECYSPDDVQRWENDDWFYVGVGLSVSRNGVELSDHAASLWGIECNFAQNNDYLSEVAQELQGEALTTAAHELARIRDALAA